MNSDLKRSEQVPFLPAGVELLVSVNAEPGISPGLAAFLESSNDLEVKPPRYCYVRVILLEDLKITFRLFSNGNIKRELEGCRCQIPALPDEEIYSLNQAYQKISAAYEPSRTSVGGRVYDNFYFQGCDGVWRLLEEKRKEVYRPFRDKFGHTSLDIKEKKLRNEGIALPKGTYIIVRRDSHQPIVTFPIELYHLMNGKPPFD